MRYLMLLSALLMSILSVHGGEVGVVYAAGRDELCVLSDHGGIWRKTAAYTEEQPMYLAKSPLGSQLAVALNGSAVRLYGISSSGELQRGAKIDVGGKTCCHVSYSPSGTVVYGANYTGGNIFALDVTGNLRFQHDTSAGKTDARPHPHYAAQTSDGRHLAVCDLGLDRVFLFPLSGDIPLADGRVDIPLPSGAGPRHLLFSPAGSMLYVANERNSTLSVFRKDKGTWMQVQTLDASARLKGTRNYPGALRFSENGRFLLVTNRVEESIAVFALCADGRLSKRQEIGTAAYPSDILQFGDTLLVACKKGDCVEVRRFTPATGEISGCLEAIPLPGAHALAR